MRRLGTLSGTGMLVIGEDRFDRIGYTISVWQEDKGWRSAAGMLRGEPDAFRAAARWGETPLYLASGEAVTVLVRRIEAGGDRAEVRVVGPVPDPR
jgi:hypothetical protein